MEDKKLIRLLRKDPNAGMEALMDQYTGLVYAVVKGKFADYYYVSSDIEDCVADVFSKFYMNLSEYDPSVASIKGYLCVIARNHAINVVKKRSMQGDASLYETAILAQGVEEDSIDSILIEDERCSEVLKAIEALGDPDSSILFRKYYYGQSAKSIGKVLGLSVTNVNTRAHRALEKLREMLGGREI